MRNNQKQMEIYYYIKGYLITEGFTPSIREIGKAVHLKSTSSVQRYMERMEKDGTIIKAADGSARYTLKGARVVFYE